jgi:hypothetical protein
MQRHFLVLLPEVRVSWEGNLSGEESQMTCKRHGLHHLVCLQL